MEKYIITMLGEKDHGKSTLIGNLLIGTGSTTEARIAEVKKASKSKRFEPAHILDSFSEERENEMTIDTTRAELVYKKAILELIDVPGHLELIKNMMSGASNSDIAILMVSVKENEGFSPQTKRHIFLSSMFGVKALIIAINKMDSAKYDQKVFEKVKSEISKYLKLINFDKPVVFVPISAYNNENIISRSKNTKWYKGDPLLELVYNFAKKHSKNNEGKRGKLRILMQDSMKIDGKKAFFGVLYNGKVKVGENIKIEPQDISARIAKIYVKGRSVTLAKAGTNIAMLFDKTVKIDKGDVIYGKNEKPHQKGAFSAKMFMIKEFNTKGNKNISIKLNNNDIPVKSIKVLKILSPISGEISNKSERSFVNKVLYAQLSLNKAYPVEKFSEYNELGRFAVYENENFVGVGVVE